MPNPISPMKTRSAEALGPSPALAEEVGVLLLAEGVETAEQLQVLVALGMPAAQGYHLGVPVLQEQR